MRIARPVRYALYLALFVALRAQLCRDSPLLLTADSWDYVGASTAIAHRLDFSAAGEIGLRDCRVPGYPMFQAVFLPLTHLRSGRILAIQAALGLAGVAIGWGIGRALRRPAVGEALALFLGLNPIYLFNEHSLMTEGLSLVTLLAFVMAAILCWRDGPGPRKGLLLGALLGACALVRINALPFCATVAAGVLLVSARRDRRGAVPFAGALGLAALAVAGPWIARNYGEYHKICMSLHTNRTLLVYKTMHGSVDPRLPRLLRTSTALGRESLDYDWLWALTGRYGPIKAEEVAGRLLREQVRRHPGRHLGDIARSVVGFGGIYETVGDDRSPTRYWFEHHVGRVAVVRRIFAQWESIAARVGLAYEAAGADSIWTRGWRAMGQVYLVQVRPALYFGVFAALAFHAFGALRGTPGRDAAEGAAIRWLGAGYLATVAFHSLTLTDSDRFSSLYDWVALLIVLLVATPRPLGPPRVDGPGRTPLSPEAVLS